jgi:hypothetical protein
MKSIKNIVFFLVLGFITSFAVAQTTPEEYINKFFTEISKANYSKALDLMPISKKLESDTSFVDKSLKKLEAGPSESGKYCGYELISKEELSPSFITFDYFIKYQDVPQRIQFVFYKPLDSWQLNRINFSGPAGQGQKPGSRQKFIK